MKGRPLAGYSAIQRDILWTVVKSPGANGEQLRRRLEDLRDDRVADSTARTNLAELVANDLVEKSGPKWERSHEITDVGRELLDADLDWQRE